MTGGDFITFAGKIAAIHSDPAGCRTAIGRSYYGAFHLAKAFLSEIGVAAPRSEKTHEFIQRCLQNCGHDRASEVGDLLRDLYADRLISDYQLELARIETVVAARIAVESAMRIQRALSSLGEEDRHQIQAGIRTYEARISPGGREQRSN